MRWKDIAAFEFDRNARKTRKKEQSVPVEPMLEVDDLQCLYRLRRSLADLATGKEVRNVHAVDGLELNLGRGQTLAIVGESGCGKTTLLRIAAGLQVPSSGKVFLGRSLVSAPGGVQVPPEKRNVGLAFQESALFPHLTVLENVCFGISTLPKKQKQARALDLLERLGMAGSANVYPHTLSGGQQQRVALARALAPSPRVMLLDEPFSSLDARLRDQIRDDTLHVLKELNTATLLVTHDPEEAMFMADRIALMRDGEIVQTGSPTELYCNPVEPFVVNFFGQVNEHVGIVHDGQVATPLGRLDASRFDEGANVRILIRPEAVKVTPLEGKVADDRTSHVVPRLPLPVKPASAPMPWWSLRRSCTRLSNWKGT